MESKRLGRTQDPTILVLTSLTGGPKHGYAIIKDIEEMTGTVFGPGTLYGVLVRLEEEGLVAALPLEGPSSTVSHHWCRLGRTDGTTAERDEGRDDRSEASRSDRLIVGRSLIDVALRCYPKWWTERYGEEMRAVIDDLEARGPIAQARSRSDCFATRLRSRLQARGMPRTYGLLATSNEDVGRRRHAAVVGDRALRDSPSPGDYVLHSSSGFVEVGFPFQLLHLPHESRDRTAGCTGSVRRSRRSTRVDRLSLMVDGRPVLGHADSLGRRTERVSQRDRPREDVTIDARCI